MTRRPTDPCPLVRREQVRQDQYFVAVLIDAVGNRRAAQFVRVNAAGVIADSVHIAAGDSEDLSPDFEVDAAEQRVQQGFINHRGVRALSDSAMQWLGVLHFSARDCLRAVWQATRYWREADALAAIAAGRNSGRKTSLALQHRAGLGRSLAVGASSQRNEPGNARHDELFVKAAFAI